MINKFFVRQFWTGDHDIFWCLKLSSIATGLVALFALGRTWPHAIGGRPASHRSAEWIDTLGLVTLGVINAAAASAAFAASNRVPQFPALGLGWIHVAAAVAIGCALLGPGPRRGTPFTMLVLAAVLIFVAAHGPAHGTRIAGTIAWNAVSDIDLARWVPSCLAAAVIGQVCRRTGWLAREGRQIDGTLGAGLAATIVFALTMGLPITTLIAVAVPVIAALGGIVLVTRVLTDGRRMRPSARRDCLVAASACLAPVAGVALVLRGLAHLGEAAALVAVGVGVAAGIGGRVRRADVANVFHRATGYVVVVAVAFTAAALWTVAVNSHLPLADVVRGAGIPLVAVLVAGLVATALAARRFGAVAAVATLSPVLYIGMSQGLVVPEVVALALGAALTTPGRRGRFASPPRRALRPVLIGIALLAVWAVAAPRLVGHGNLTRAGIAAAFPALAGSTTEAREAGRRNVVAPANTWVPLVTWGIPPARAQHGGSALDTKRNRILFFGADTHGRDWNNAVTAFDVDSRTWTRLYRPAPRYALRADPRGIRVSGVTRRMPWPMHTYDGVVYHARADTLVVIGAPLHIGKTVAGGRYDPTWLYDLADRRWRMGPLTGETRPRFFGAAAAYDPGTGAVWAFADSPPDRRHVAIGQEHAVLRAALWRLNPDLSTWRFVSTPSAPVSVMGVTVLFDIMADRVEIFTGGASGGRLHTYAPDAHARGQAPPRAGRWRHHVLDGDLCGQRAAYPGYPTAARPAPHIVVAVPTKADGRPGRTCVHIPERGETVRLSNADTPRIGMNFNMHYVPADDRFLLIHGNGLHGDRAKVHALRLDDIGARKAVSRRARPPWRGTDTR